MNLADFFDKWGAEPEVVLISHFHEETETGDVTIPQFHQAPEIILEPVGEANRNVAGKMFSPPAVKTIDKDFLDEAEQVFFFREVLNQGTLGKSTRCGNQIERYVFKNILPKGPEGGFIYLRFFRRGEFAEGRGDDAVLFEGDDYVFIHIIIIYK
ncbi:hypothetical protein TRIP_C90340 [Candidatus Zixiibacteriota bacterium]|nr:hypothetical protein TRIP_C90340 [candidate division Zixibacteria bacterium]